MPPRTRTNRLVEMIRNNAGALSPDQAAYDHDPAQAPNALVEDYRHADPDYPAESAPSYDATQGGGFPLPAQVPAARDVSDLPIGALRRILDLRDTWTRERPADGWAVQQYSWGSTGSGPGPTGLAIQIAPLNPLRRSALIVVTAGTIVVGPNVQSLVSITNGLPLTAVASFELETTAPVWALGMAAATVSVVQLFDVDGGQAPPGRDDEPT